MCKLNRDRTRNTYAIDVEKKKLKWGKQRQGRDNQSRQLCIPLQGSGPKLSPGARRCNPYRFPNRVDGKSGTKTKLVKAKKWNLKAQLGRTERRITKDRFSPKNDAGGKD